MKTFALLFVLLGSSALTVPKGEPQCQTDSGTVAFLRRNLVSGGDVHYPPDAAKAKQRGSVSYLMELAADGSVASLTLKRSSGHKALDEHVARTLKCIASSRDQKPNQVAELCATSDRDREAVHGGRKGPAGSFVAVADAARSLEAHVRESGRETVHGSDDPRMRFLEPYD